MVERDVAKWSNYNPVKEYVNFVAVIMWSMKSIFCLNARNSHTSA